MLTIYCFMFHHVHQHLSNYCYANVTAYSLFNGISKILCKFTDE